MNIKSLLLGTSAALLAVSGARAADAVEVAAEPEAMEYVRVCDTYGTGYFYIPGTETCLRIGGYVRFDVSAGNGPYGGHNVADRLNNRAGSLTGDRNDTYHHQARFSLQTWTGTETELGTLKTYTETRFNYGDRYHAGGGNSGSLNFAWIQLGGFRIGKDESAFTTFAGYAGSVMADDMIAFGGFDTNLISYTFDAGNGFSAIISLESGSGFGDWDDDGVVDAGEPIFEIDSYVPHVVAGVKYAGGWGSATLVGAYDSNYEEFAIKGRVDVNVNEQLSVFVMAAYGSNDYDLAYGEVDNFKKWGGDWAAWAGTSYKFSDKATFNIQGSYSDETLTSFNSGWAVAANVAYQVVPGFTITPEVTYSDLDRTDAPGTDGFGGMIRFQRDF